MALSLIPGQLPEQRMHIISIEEILTLGENIEKKQPPLEHYFSPTRKELFIKDYLHFLNSTLLEVKHGNLDMDTFIVLALSFQFTAPLLEIHSEKELRIFYHLLEHKYNVEDLDINLHFNLEGKESAEENENVVNQEEAISSFQLELDNSYEGRREVKESVQKRLKQDGNEAVMKWQKTKDLPELAEAFGRSIVIPAFFSYVDKKLIHFYESSTPGISYEIEVPELIL